MFLELKPEWQTPDRHFCPVTPSSGSRVLHLFYSLLNLQKEIEKRTFYLGKYRTDENGNKPHLLDLIGMSRDEADILYPFAKSAMADVFDALHSSTIGIPKLYKWEDKPGSISIKSKQKLSVSSVKFANLNAIAQSDFIKIEGKIEYDCSNNSDKTQILDDICRPCMTLAMDYTTTRSNISTGEVITTPHTVTVALDKRHIKAGVIKDSSSSPNTITHDVSCFYPFHLAPQDGVFTQEQLSGDIAISNQSLSQYFEFTKPTKIASGTRFVISNNPSAPKDTEYSALTEFTENDLPEKLSSVAEVISNGETINEGIHYYFEFPNYFNDSLIEPLDNAILEALVNRVIWHWLILSYPAEAATYDSLYQASIAALKTRSDIFQKHWAQRTPRIL